MALARELSRSIQAYIPRCQNIVVLKCDLIVCVKNKVRGSHEWHTCMKRDQFQWLPWTTNVEKKRLVMFAGCTRQPRMMHTWKVLTRTVHACTCAQNTHICMYCCNVYPNTNPRYDGRRCPKHHKIIAGSYLYLEHVSNECLVCELYSKRR